LTVVQLVMHEDLCKGCGLCQSACPRNLLTFASRINKLGFQPAVAESLEECTGCAMCARMCPDLAIEIRKSS
jgi:2-oxoglutarate ferredoxin oxidoreductase subunit delta